jgi:hypothetical protein
MYPEANTGPEQPDPDRSALNLTHNSMADYLVFRKNFHHEDHKGHKGRKMIIQEKKTAKKGI